MWKSRGPAVRMTASASSAQKIVDSGIAASSESPAVDSLGGMAEGNRWYLKYRARTLGEVWPVTWRSCLRRVNLARKRLKIREHEKFEESTQSNLRTGENFRDRDFQVAEGRQVQLLLNVPSRRLSPNYLPEGL